MNYEILDEHGIVLKTIVADEAFVIAQYPGRYRLEENTLPAQLPTEADYDAAMTAMYDARARERRYENHITCALRAGYTGPFQAEGSAFAQWMDACNAEGYRLRALVLAGQMPQPTIPELLGMLPVLTWPAPVAQ